QTAWALGFYTVGLVGFASVKIGAQAFYALGDTRTPVKVAVGAMALNSLLAISLVFPLRHGGLAFATACSATAEAVTRAGMLRRRLRAVARRRARRARAGWMRTVAASAVLAAALILAGWAWPPPSRRVAEVLWLAGMVGGGALVYALAH